MILILSHGMSRNPFDCEIAPRSDHLISCESPRVNRNHSAMSPNPENIHFQNVFQPQRPQHFDDEDAGNDSGFGSGGFSTSHQNQIFSSTHDYEILMTNKKELFASGLYYPELDSVAAMQMLKKSSVGTFLIRDSSDSQHLFSLTVKTNRGATSVRIMYQNGWFMFDCDERIRQRMPKFHSVLSLVNHHVELSRQGAVNSWRWEEKSGRKNMIVNISNPCRTSAPSLQQLCTIVVNKYTDKMICHPKDYATFYKCIQKYPFKF